MCEWRMLCDGCGVLTSGSGCGRGHRAWLDLLQVQSWEVSYSGYWRRWHGRGVGVCGWACLIGDGCSCYRRAVCHILVRDNAGSEEEEDKGWEVAECDARGSEKEGKGGGGAEGR